MKLEHLLESSNISEKYRERSPQALFIIGGPGSGKSMVSRILSGSLEMRHIDSDKFFELLLKKKGLGTDISKGFTGDTEREFIDSLNRAEKQLHTLIERGVNVLIDTTGKNYRKIFSLKQKLEDNGYHTSMVFVNTPIEQALDRNASRDRKLNTDVVSDIHQEVRKNIGAFEYMFDDDFMVIDNDDQLKDEQINKVISRLR